jgi:hypothetical protein
MRRLLLSMVAVVLAAAFAAGCSNGSSSSGPIPTKVSGNVLMGGPVSQASVTLFAIDPSSRKLARLASATTDAAGAYTVVAVLGGQAYLIVATGGTYTEDATGVSHSLGTTRPATLDDATPGVLEAMVGFSSAGTADVTSALVLVTPLTTIGSRRVVELSLSAGAAVLVESAVVLANQAVTQALNVGSAASPVDPRALMPLDFTNPSDAAAIKQNPLAAAALYGAALSAISQSASTLGLTSSTTLVDALAMDFADGTFDGMGPSSNGVPVPVPLSSGTLPPTAGTTGLAQATTTFLDDPAHNASGTTAASMGPQ